MPDYHTWNEVQVVLFALGWRQLTEGEYGNIPLDEDILIYQNGEVELLIPKEKKLTRGYIETYVCPKICLSYDDFHAQYRAEYAKRYEVTEESQVREDASPKETRSERSP